MHYQIRNNTSKKKFLKKQKIETRAFLFFINKKTLPAFLFHKNSAYI